MVSLVQIDKELLVTDGALENNFVGIGIETDPTTGQGFHSVLVIGVNKKNYIFHFGGHTVDLEDSTKTSRYYVKYVNHLVDPTFSVSFLVFCKQILKFPAPQYGFIYADAMYDINGQFICKKGITNYATCVGFCMNVLRLFIKGDKYFELDDWKANSMLSIHSDYPDYFDRFYDRFCKLNPHISKTQFDAVYKRITPSEYLTSAWIETLPIYRTDVNSNIENVVNTLKSRTLSP